MEDALEFAANGINLLEVAKIAYDAGRSDIIEQLGNFSFDCDDEYAFAMEAMDLLCDFVRDNDSGGDEESNIETMYFSSHNMMEYYRLCREYGKLKGISLKANPYMQSAAAHVREQMIAPDCYYCNSILQTKINHKWASGIVFQYDGSYFTEYLALFSRLLYVFEFYDCEVSALRYEVWKLKYGRKNNLLMLPLPRDERRAA